MGGGKIGERSNLELREYPGINMVHKASRQGVEVCVLSLPKKCYLQECCTSELILNLLGLTFFFHPANPGVHSVFIAEVMAWMYQFV